MVVFRGLILSTCTISVLSSASTALYFGEKRNNVLQTMWGRARSDFAAINGKSGVVLQTIRKQSRIKISESMHHIADSIPQIPPFPLPLRSVIQCGDMLPFEGRGGSTAIKKKRQNNSGSYYGIKDEVFFPGNADDKQIEIDKENKGLPAKPPSSRSNALRKQDREIPSSRTLTDIMSETLLELREMREDIYSLREEMRYMKEELKRQEELSSGGYRDEIDDDDDVEAEVYEYPTHDSSKHHRKSLIERVAQQSEYENIGQEVEKWAHRMLFEEGGEEHGWKEVKCNKMVRKKFNSRGQTTCYLKWMKDSRGKYAKNDGAEFPCIKCFTTIDAPMEDVCDYLSNENHMEEYNDLVVAHRDLEDISPHGKICWSQCPQILFIKPRDFVTYCHHRWRRDGAQIVVSQACEHEDAPGNSEESDDKACRASSLRGANFISRDPNDPNRTRMAILAHADPGGGVPQWAMKTAMNAVAPIEPFKLFHKIDQRVAQFKPSSPREKVDIVNSQGRTMRPAGLSQLGYACFWPKGGGKVGHTAENVSSVGDSAAYHE